MQIHWEISEIQEHCNLWRKDQRLSGPPPVWTLVLNVTFTMKNCHVWRSGRQRHLLYEPTTNCEREGEKLSCLMIRPSKSQSNVMFCDACCWVKRWVELWVTLQTSPVRGALVVLDSVHKWEKLFKHNYWLSDKAANSYCYTQRTNYAFTPRAGFIDAITFSSWNCGKGGFGTTNELIGLMCI